MHPVTFLMHAQAHTDTNYLQKAFDSFSEDAEILCTPPPDDIQTTCSFIGIIATCVAC